MVLVSKGSYRAKRMFEPKTWIRTFQLVYMADIRYLTCGDFLIDFIKGKIKFCTRYSQLEAQYKFSSEHQ
jgi:hypothetical protein